MKSYKISVSKENKKYTIILKAETEKIARERIHKEGYSILSIEENINIESNKNNIFIFSGYNKKGELKHGKIVGEDILKIYIKLRKDLEYSVIELFHKDDINLKKEKKEKIISDLKEEYNLFFTGKKKERIDILREKINKEKNSNKKQDNFYLKKELDETYKNINFILKKIENLLSGSSNIDIDLNQKNKLKIVYNSIIKLKKTTNISKLKEIGELALIKIGKIELQSLKKRQDKNTKLLLKNTNNLLKKIGSKESIIEENKKIGYLFKLINDKISNYFILKKRKKYIKKGIDKHSHLYIKNILFLKKYKEKLKESNKQIFTNIFSLLFNKEKRIDFFIRRKVIKQNIILFKAKEKGISFSYTSLKKGVNKIINYILNIVYNINEYIFFIIISYTIIFILFLNVKEVNYEGLFYFIILYLLYLIIHFTRNIFLIILNFVILFFIIIFGVVNF